MRSSNLLFLTIFCGLLFIPVGQDKLEVPFSHVPFFTTTKFGFAGVGVKTDGADIALTNYFRVPNVLSNIGYALREYFVQIPTFLSLKIAAQSGKKHLIVRKEADSSFLGTRSEPVYAEIRAALELFLRRFEQSIGVRPIVLIVPTKIFANQIEASITDVEEPARDLFGISDSSPGIPAAYMQEHFEEELRKDDVPVVSLLNEYRAQQKQIKPLYPYGESHWRPELVARLGFEIVRQMVALNEIPKLCENKNLKFSEGRLVPYFGDLAKAVGLDERSPFADRFKTLLREGELRDVENPSLNTNCPKIIFAGSSYGDAYRGEGDIAMAIRAAYHGVVENLSIPGRSALFPMESLMNRPFTGREKVIWEFPFRSLRDCARKDGLPYCD